MDAIHLNQWEEIFNEIAHRIVAHEKKFNDLDSLIGDGDHGTSIKRGFDAASVTVSDTSFTTVGELFIKIGSVMMDEIGGAIGPLLGTFFLALAKSAGDTTETDLQTWSIMFSSAVERISALGKAQPGDKTLLDALQPADEAFQEASQLGLPLRFAFQNAAAEARRGADQTSKMVAKFGRAKFLGERSLGYQDPGANSMALILNTIAECLIRLDESNEIDVRETEYHLDINNKNIEVTFNKNDGLLSITSQFADYVLRQAHPFTLLSSDGHIFQLSNLSTWYLENNQVILTFRTNAGGKKTYLVIDFPLSQSCQIRVLTQQDGISQSSVKFASSLTENFFGGGERFASVNQRGKRLEGWTDDHGPEQLPDHAWTYFPVPFFISNRGYGFLLHNYEKNSLDLCAADPSTLEVSVDTPNIQIETFWADQPIDNIGLFLQRTGRPPLPPKWNNGVWVTCLGGQEAVLEKARFLRREHVPCSALWVYDANNFEGNIGWPICPMHHSGVYPDVPGMVKQLHEMGFKVQTYLFPYFYEDSPLYTEAENNGYFLKNADGTTYRFPFWRAVGRDNIMVPSSIVDFTNPDAKLWWQGLIRYVLVDLGYDGWMHDFGESIPEGVIAYNGLRGVDLHNQYPVLYQQAAREACLQVKPDASFYARSGFTGSPAWLTAAWTGDQICTWNEVIGLSSVLPACLSLSISGVFYIGPDIGGYFSRNLPQEADSFSKELWIRWTQVGALSSIMRDHLADKPDGSIELWTDQETLVIFKQYAWLHMSLSPYIQSCAKQAVELGHPIMRHMFLVEPDNPAFWNCDDQYLFGDSLLIAPVLEDGARSRTVLLPNGPWIDYWSGECFEGGKEVSLPAPIDQIPLMVKEGTILPTLLDPADTLVEAVDESVVVASDDLKLQVFLSPDWKGKTTAPIVSHRQLVDGTEIDSTWITNTIHLKIKGHQTRSYLIEIPSLGEPVACLINGQSFSLEQKAEAGNHLCWYDVAARKILVRCEDLNIDLEITT